MIGENENTAADLIHGGEDALIRADIHVLYAI